MTDDAPILGDDEPLRREASFAYHTNRCAVRLKLMEAIRLVNDADPLEAVRRCAEAIQLLQAMVEMNQRTGPYR